MSLSARRRALMSMDRKQNVLVLLASGTYVLSGSGGSSASLDIPVPSFSGIPAQVLVYAPTPVQDEAQTYRWAAVYDVAAKINSVFGRTVGRCVYKAANGNDFAGAPAPELKSDGTTLSCGRAGGSYPILDNTYSWYIWGYSDTVPGELDEWEGGSY